MSAEHPTFAADFRRFFGRGLAVLLPSILTLWLLWYAFVFVFNSVAVPINRGIQWAVVTAAPHFVPANPERQPRWYVISEQERTEYVKSREGQSFKGAAPARIDGEIRTMRFREFWQSRWYLPATGLLVAIAVIYLAGKMVGGLVGRRLYGRAEAFIGRAPFLKHVYPHVKQLVEMIMGDKPMAFKRVVLVEYPRKGIWTLGLVTSSSLKAVADRAGGRCLAVFIPSTPTPFTGFAITVPETDVIDLPISIDEAIRFVLAGGVLSPEQRATPPLPAEAERLPVGPDARRPA